jgi:predicted transcriptional regulator
MKDLWNRGDPTVGEVLDRLNGRATRKLAYNTVMSVMARLERKGILERERVGRVYLYRPTATREQFLASEASRAARQVLDEYGELGVASFVQQVSDEPALREKVDELLARVQPRNREPPDEQFLVARPRQRRLAGLGPGRGHRRRLPHLAVRVGRSGVVRLDPRRQRGVLHVREPLPRRAVGRPAPGAHARRLDGPLRHRRGHAGPAPYPHRSGRAPRRGRGAIRSEADRRGPVRREAELLESPATDPWCFCVGWLRPRIVISAGFVARLDLHQLCAVLAHERHHAERRDPLRLMIARVLTAVAYPVPSLRDLFESALLESELVADRAAMEAADRRALAGALRIALASPPPPRIGVAFAADDNSLVRAACLAGETVRTRRWRRHRLAASAAIVGLTVVVSLILGPELAVEVPR